MTLADGPGWDMFMRRNNIFGDIAEERGRQIDRQARESAEAAREDIR